MGGIPLFGPLFTRCCCLFQHAKLFCIFYSLPSNDNGSYYTVLLCRSNAILRTSKYILPRALPPPLEVANRTAGGPKDDCGRNIQKYPIWTERPPRRNNNREWPRRRHENEDENTTVNGAQGRRKRKKSEKSNNSQLANANACTKLKRWPAAWNAIKHDYPHC